MSITEGHQKLLNSITTFFVVVIRHPSSFAQFHIHGEPFIGVWSTRKKAQHFIKMERIVASGPRVIALDSVGLQTFGRKAGVTKMVLDYCGQNSDTPVMWFYLSTMGTH